MLVRIKDKVGGSQCGLVSSRHTWCDCESLERSHEAVVERCASASEECYYECSGELVR